MSLGYDRQLKIVSLGDTVSLSARLYNEEDQLYSYEDLGGVEFVIQRPDKTKVNDGDGIQGEILEDGTGLLNFDQTSDPDTFGANQSGHYIVVAMFELVDGTKKSTRCDFEAFDPFEVVAPATRIIADGVWTKLEDCFDAENEGPWVQDMTLNYFREEKMEKFINDALFDINYQNPPTNLAVSSFVTSNGNVTSNYPLLVQGVLIQVIRHLMRSYVEQPMPTGVQVGWQDRRDYLQRWREVFDIEKQQYDRWVALYKRGYLQLGHSKVLVAAKAGRLIPAPMRARSVGRGYW